MSSTCEHNAPWKLSIGTSQKMRTHLMLNPDSIQLMDLEIEDWLRFARQFSEEVKYYGLDDKKDGNWAAFYPEFSSVDSLAIQAKELIESDDIDNAGSITPHLALFISFVQLLEFSKKRLNGITRRHLDFYFKEVLGMKPKDATPDDVFILFELSKNAQAQKVDKGFLLKGGKDANGKERLYETTDEYVVNAAQVTDLRSIFNNSKDAVYASLIANSYNGLGADFPDDNIQWWPFGHSGDDTTYQDKLPLANLGWGIASQILAMKEGTRNVTLTYEFESAISAAENKVLANLKTCLSVLFSGEKDWIESTVKSVASSGKKLTIVLEVGADKAPIVAYDETVFEIPFTTQLPLAICNINQEVENAYEVYELLSTNSIKKLDIKIDVTSMVDLIMENDQGPLDATKPFLPFGISPKEDSNFYISANEALQKNWDEITIGHLWDNAPDQFGTHYTKYVNEFRNNPTENNYLDPVNKTRTKIVSGNDHFTFDLEILEGGFWIDYTNKLNDNKLFNNTSRNTIEISKTLSSSPSGSGSSGSSSASGSGSVSNSLSGSSGLRMLGSQAANLIMEAHSSAVGQLIYDASITSGSSQLSAQAKQGFIKVRLNQSFLHELYPSLFTVAMTLIAKGPFPDLELPQTAYLPTASGLTLSYGASETQSFQSNADHVMDHYHQHPFGVSRNETHLISAVPPISSNLTIVPRVSDGTLYVGLTNLVPRSIVSLLIQVVDGSENPDATLQYEGDEKIIWSILSNNKWQVLNDDYLVADETDNFLKSGLVKFSVPADADEGNTLLPSGLKWIKAENVKSSDAVCRIKGIHAQAVRARFKNNNNETSHLLTGIEGGTIAKPVIRISNIKGLTQLYSSFGGSPIQSDESFYQTTSERLRHRNRAVRRWDYEHLILAKFNEIYKVACLNHTDDHSTLAPGEVSIVVIPDIRNDNIFNPYQPKVSKAYRNEIERYVNALNTLHVDSEVINPTYEEVKVSVSVRFNEDVDDNFYQKQLKSDLASYLAPWAFDQDALVELGGSINESQIIYFMEKLSYVDYVSDVILFHRVDGDVAKRHIEVTDPRNILTSVVASDHQVSIAPVKCNLNN